MVRRAGAARARLRLFHPGAAVGSARAMKKDLRTLTVRQVMERTGFGRDVVYRLVSTGKVAHIRCSSGRGAIRILEASLEAFFEQQLAAEGKRRSLPVEKPALDADDELD